tara:strand:- start:72 stop:584 length:513 start_codon:yes stop_codon:yes gene_type:complete
VKRQDLSENQVKIVYLGVGSNIGNRLHLIEKTKYYLVKNNVKLISTSSFYESLSWPNPKNPKFLNIVLKCKCTYSPAELFNICQIIEKKLGRKKAPKNSPRKCDIDIIDFNGIKLNGKIFLPHKMMHKRNFVLFPLFEIDKNWVHPITRINIKELIFSLSNNNIRSIKKI